MPKFRILYINQRNYDSLEAAQAAAQELPYDLPGWGAGNNWMHYQGGYDTLDEVEQEATRMNRRYENEYWFVCQPVPFQYEYMKREFEKLLDGEDFWEYQAEDAHCALITEKGMVSFYESPDKGEKDRRTEMRVGRYLRRYRSYDFDENRISEIAAKCGAKIGDAKLKFARTREDCKRVYVDGPRSCMSGERSLGNDNLHPCEAYASPDLAVAYIERDDEITARAVVNMNTKKWVRTYGDTVRLEEMLKAEGYRHSSWALAGARLLKIYVDSGSRERVLTPYLDGNVCDILYDEEDEDYMTIDNPPRRLQGTTDGYAYI